ncbi:hypothetical protein A2U01_0047445, partial [Trifolium medium]|nr:hypothetical protein [Trifolium medium]
NTHLAAVYYNHRKPNLLRIQVDVTLADLKHQLKSRLHFRDRRKETDVEYRCPSVCSDKTVLGCIKNLFSIEVYMHIDIDILIGPAKG